MKTLSLFFYSFCCTAFMMPFSMNVNGQNVVTWKGGAAGQPNEWNYAKNWSNYKVPDAFSNVVIPDVSSTTQANPIIQGCEVEVNSILLTSNASLIVEKDAQLVVFDTENGFGNGPGLILRGTLLNINLPEEPSLKKSLAIEVRN